MPGGIGEIPLNALVAGENHLEKWHLEPFHMVAAQAWRLSSHREVTDGILLEMGKETRKMVNEDEPQWASEVYQARRWIACWCDHYEIPDRRIIRGTRSPMKQVLAGGLDTVCRRAKLSPQRPQSVTMRVPSEVKGNSIVFAYDALCMRKGVRVPENNPYY